MTTFLRLPFVVRTEVGQGDDEQYLRKLFDAVDVHRSGGVEFDGFVLIMEMEKRKAFAPPPKDAEIRMPVCLLIPLPCAFVGCSTPGTLLPRIAVGAQPGQPLMKSICINDINAGCSMHCTSKRGLPVQAHVL